LKTPSTRDYSDSGIVFSQTGNPLTKFVNLCQCSAERRDKYGFCREFDLPPWLAYRLRDWHWPKINMYIEAYHRSKQLQMIFPSPGGALPAND